jgi:hypothetical protein
MGDLMYVFLTSTVVEGSDQLHTLASPGERAPGTDWVGGWVGLRTGMDEYRLFIFLKPM